ncbi:Bug family tripartite tricarboxylate transporter substrate binding protein [Polaromonas glacialis]|uniref:Bug family tripartite tricarboxylate transporter substrate binding protein n=1 Tax=Polaromonas glacialis TaxID=866564 RepID=UPI000A043984|nr:tripartite tricarboxylate transporter substrate binding protein [Polaromonas glacialis]
MTVAPALTVLSHAQEWPGKKPITLVLGFPAGGSADIVARTIAEPLGKRLGATIIVENLSGAAGTIAGQKVVNAAPDGYTLLMGSSSEVTIARMFNPAVKYNGETDLSHIGLIGVQPLMLVAGPKSGVKTLEEALAKARREPNTMSFASSGVGSALHVAGELLNQKAGIKIDHVPYRGAQQMTIDIAGGNVDFGFLGPPTAMPHIESGKMIALAVTSAGRTRVAPQVPALSEAAALKGFEITLWNGLFGPAKLPAPMVARLNKALNEVIQEPQVWQKLQKAGVTTEGGTPQEFSRRIRDEAQRVRSVAPSTMPAGAGA